MAAILRGGVYRFAVQLEEIIFTEVTRSLWFDVLDDDGVLEVLLDPDEDVDDSRVPVISTR